MCVFVCLHACRRKEIRVTGWCTKYLTGCGKVTFVVSIALKILFFFFNKHETCFCLCKLNRYRKIKMGHEENGMRSKVIKIYYQ